MWKPRQLRRMADVLFISGITVRPPTRFDRLRASLPRLLYIAAAGSWSCACMVLRWPYGHADQWVRLPAWGFLLVSYSDHSPKMHRSELGAWDRQTDGRTDGRTYRSVA